jgi:hypothetical protein
MLQNLAYCTFANPGYGLQAQSKNIFDCELARLSIQTCHLLQSAQTHQRLLFSEFVLQLFSHKADKFGRLGYVVDSHNFEPVLDPRFQHRTLHLSLTFGKASTEVSFKQIDHVTKPTVFEPILLLLVPAIVYGADEVVSFFALHHVVHNLSLVLPHKIAEG